MALESCTICKGTGWKMVARPDGAGRMAVACDCGMEERANRVLQRAHIPKRYEHCDFESYVTDLADGIIPSEAIRRVMDACWNVETLPNAAEIAKMSVSS